MENFLKYTVVTLLLIFAWTPLLVGLLDTMLMFLFDYTTLQWTPGRFLFAICWTMLPAMVLTSAAFSLFEG